MSEIVKRVAGGRWAVLALALTFGLFGAAETSFAQTITTFASGFREAIGLTFDGAGNLYVADTLAGTVSKITPGGAVSTFVSGLNEPFGLAFDGAGNLYVADSGDGTVRKVTPGGTVSTFASGFNNPTGLAFDGAGNLYVANGSVVSKDSLALPVPTLSEWALMGLAALLSGGGLFALRRKGAFGRRGESCGGTA
jgi:sugar lactone lactonase YvrE